MESLKEIYETVANVERNSEAIEGDYHPVLRELRKALSENHIVRRISLFIDADLRTDLLGMGFTGVPKLDYDIYRNKWMTLLKSVLYIHATKECLFYLRTYVHLNVKNPRFKRDELCTIWDSYIISNLPEESWQQEKESIESRIYTNPFYFEEPSE